jgi:hypothetical protein
MLSNSLNSPRSQAPEAHASRLPQDRQLGSILGLALLYQTQALAKHLARILVTAGAHKSLNGFSLDVSSAQRFE